MMQIVSIWASWGDTVTAKAGLNPTYLVTVLAPLSMVIALGCMALGMPTKPISRVYIWIAGRNIARLITGLKGRSWPAKVINLAVLQPPLRVAIPLKWVKMQLGMLPTLST